MKKLLNVWGAVCLFSVILLSCEQAGIKQSPPAGTPPGGSQAHVQSSTSQAFDGLGVQAGDLSERELRMLFHLEKEKISASEAAQKVAAGSGKKIAMFTFSENEAVSYDDMAGTFTVKVRGSVRGGEFDKELSFEGFVNPYAKVCPAFSGADLNFDKAIEFNTPLAAFIAEANASVPTVLNRLSFIDNKAGVLNFGEHEHYILSADLEQADDKIRIKPVYTVKHRQKERGGRETFIKEEHNAPFLRLAKDLTLPYFSKEDVFQYLMDKTDDSIINVSSQEFASMHYAFAKHLNVTPGSLINDAEIQKIMARYNEPGGQYKMEIDTALFQPKTTGIEADDYTGTLKLTYCIAEKEQIAEMLAPEDPSVKPVSVKRDVSVTGFKTVNPETVDSVFKFELTVAPASQTKWKNKSFNSYRFLYPVYDKERSVNVYYPDNPFADDKLPGCVLKVNGKIPEEIFAFNDVLFFSKTVDGANLFIERILLDKKRDSDILRIRIKFVGAGDEIVIEKSPE